MCRPLSIWKLGLAVAGLALFGLTSRASADTILVFGQSGGSNTVTATRSGNSTTISISAAITITFIDPNSGVSTPVSATLTLNAVSNGAAVNNAGSISQHFGSVGTPATFSITNGATNYLSGSFTDLVAGNNGANSATLSAGTGAGNVVNFNSNQIPALDLGLERALSLSFSNLTPGLSIQANTIDNFTSSVSGNFSAGRPVPEPATMAGALVGLTCLGLVKLRRRNRGAVA